MRAVIEIDEEGVLHIHLSETAEEILDVFNRAQAGELEPFAKYIEDGNGWCRDTSSGARRARARADWGNYIGG